MYKSKNAKAYILESATKYSKKEHLLALADKYDVVIMNRDTKATIVDKLEKTIGFRKMAKELYIGVPTFEIQSEFNITNKEVRKLFNCGLIRPIKKIHISGENYEYDITAYDVFDCFRLTKEKIELLLVKPAKPIKSAV